MFIHIHTHTHKLTLGTRAPSGKKEVVPQTIDHETQIRKGEQMTACMYVCMHVCVSKCVCKCVYAYLHMCEAPQNEDHAMQIKKASK